MTNTLNTPIEVSYQSLADDGINTIGGLTNEAKYYLYAPDANSFELRDEATNLPNPLSRSIFLLPRTMK